MSSESTTHLLKQIRNKNFQSSSISESLNKSIVHTPPALQPELFNKPEPIPPPELPETETSKTPELPELPELHESPKIPITLDQLLLDLKIIASVKEYDKLAINESTKQLTIDKPYILQGVLRYLYGQGREQALEYIENIINAVFTMTDDLLESTTSTNASMHTTLCFADDTKSIYQNIVHHLTSSISGLQNMKITYMKDIPCTSRIQLIIEKIQNRIQKINNLMKIH
jgi:hypothetical protein